MFIDDNCSFNLFDSILQQHKNEFDRGFLNLMYGFQKLNLFKIYYIVWERLKNNEYMILYKE